MPRQSTTFTLHSRRLFLYTSHRLLQLQTFDLAGQLEQLRHPEQRTPRPHYYKPINPAGIGPTRWQRVHATFFVPKPDAILSPIPAARDQLKLLLEQWMVGMRYSDCSLFSAPLGRI